MAIISCIAFKKFYVRLLRMYHLDWRTVISKYQVKCLIYTQNCFVIRFSHLRFHMRDKGSFQFLFCLL